MIKSLHELASDDDDDDDDDNGDDDDDDDDDDADDAGDYVPCTASNCFEFFLLTAVSQLIPPHMRQNRNARKMACCT